MKATICCLFFILLITSCQKDMSGGVNSYNVEALRSSNKVFDVEKEFTLLSIIHTWKKKN